MPAARLLRRTSTVTSSGGGGPVTISDEFTGLTAQDIAPPRNAPQVPFRFTGPGNTFGWINNTRPQNVGDAGIKAATTRGGVALPSRLENRATAGASYPGIDCGVIPTHWECTFSFDPAGPGPLKYGMHLWDTLSGVNERVPWHFGILYTGWSATSGNLQGGALLTPIGRNKDGLGTADPLYKGQFATPLARYDGTTATEYRMQFDHVVGTNSITCTFPSQTGVSPITFTDDRLSLFEETGVCMYILEDERDVAAESYNFAFRMSATIPG